MTLHSFFSQFSGIKWNKHIVRPAKVLSAHEQPVYKECCVRVELCNPAPDKQKFCSCPAQSSQIKKKKKKSAKLCNSESGMIIFHAKEGSQERRIWSCINNKVQLTSKILSFLPSSFCLPLFFPLSLKNLPLPSFLYLFFLPSLPFWPSFLPSFSPIF